MQVVTVNSLQPTTCRGTICRRMVRESVVLVVVQEVAEAVASTSAARPSLVWSSSTVT